MENTKEVPAQVVQLKTQLVSQGHTRHLLAETDLISLRIHCYAPGIGENALHSHTKEDHIFLVLEGAARFNTKARSLSKQGRNFPPENGEAENVSLSYRNNQARDSILDVGF
jgi:quercetin dioxygenase-like cupin family protein